MEGTGRVHCQSGVESDSSPISACVHGFGSPDRPISPREFQILVDAVVVGDGRLARVIQSERC